MSRGVAFFRLGHEFFQLPFDERLNPFALRLQQRGRNSGIIKSSV